MKHLFLHTMKWLVPVLFLFPGLAIYLGLPSYSFSGFILMGIGCIMIGYLLLGLCKEHHFLLFKVLRTVFSSVLWIGFLMIFTVGVLVAGASLGQPDTPCEYVVVLGAQVRAHGPSPSLQSRIDAACAYLNRHPDSIAVVSGGQGSDEPMSEAQCMFDHLTALGIPSERIWMEDRATSTWENLNFSLALIQEKTGSRPASIGLLSSEYHLFRAGLFAGECGVTAVGIPARTDSASLFVNYFLREIAGVWHYIILGGQYHD